MPDDLLPPARPSPLPLDRTLWATIPLAAQSVRYMALPGIGPRGILRDTYRSGTADGTSMRLTSHAEAPGTARLQQRSRLQVIAEQEVQHGRVNVAHQGWSGPDAERRGDHGCGHRRA